MMHKNESIPLLYYIIPPCVLSIITAIIYYPSLHYEFQFDDIANITKHYSIRHHSFKELFFSGTRWISYWLNSLHYAIGKFDPFSYRVGNVLIHISNGIFVFFITLLALSFLKKENFFKTNAFAIALLTTLLFLLHPVQTQTVSYVIQGQLEGLAAFFTLSMTLCFLKMSQAKAHLPKIIFMFVLFILAGLSCGTKEIAIISPALIILVDWFFVAQGNWQSIKQRLVLHAALGILIGSAYLYLLKPTFFTNILGFKLVAKNNIGNVITHNPNDVITPYYFFISQFKVILHYLWIFIWPFNISVEYDWLLSKHFFAPDCIFPLLGLIAIAYIIVRIIMRSPANPIAFGALWFFVCIAPRSSIIPSTELLFDYKTYIASFGFLLLLAAGLIKLFDTFMHTIHAALANKKSLVQLPILLLLTLSLSVSTIYRNTVWRSGLDFWGSIIKNAPNKARAYNNYGVELSQHHQKFEESVPYFQKAIAIDRKYPDPHNNLAVAYAQLNNIDQAIEALQQALKINPHYPEGYNNLASFFLQREQYDKAEKMLNTALKLRPHYGKAYFNLARVHLKKNDKEKAWECFKNCCTKADLDTDAGFAAYGKSSLMVQKYGDAIIAYQKVLELNPNFPEATFNLGNAYFLSKQFEKAKETYANIVQHNPQEGRSWYNLGETHLILDEPQEALNCFDKVQGLKQHIPHLDIKVALCHNSLGNHTKAQQVLESVVAHNSIPNDIKQTAAQLLGQLKSSRKNNTG